MEHVGILAFLPLFALAIGGLIGVLVARFLGLRLLLWALGVAGAVALVLVVRLATVGEGEEAGAFLPFAALTGLVFPALFGAIMGGVAGRALARRARQ